MGGTERNYLSIISGHFDFGDIRGKMMLSSDLNLE
jgi:hypothetical protein